MRVNSKNKIDYSKYSLGIIVGRFMIADLHDAHVALIDSVRANHSQVAIYLGVSEVVGTRKYPLDFSSRKAMIQELYPNVDVIPIPDKRSNLVWVKELERTIRQVYPGAKPLLYGGRDSFLEIYEANEGYMDTFEIDQTVFVSATEVRNKIAKTILSSAEFRAGKIHAIYNMSPRITTCVDIAPFRKNDTELLLARKPGEDKYRFIGGHVDLEDQTFEIAAKREFSEESGLCESSNYQYIASDTIADWRYRGVPDAKIMSILYRCEFLWGNPDPKDDICELKFFATTDLMSDAFIEANIIEEHVPFMHKLVEHLKATTIKETKPTKEKAEAIG